MSLFRRKRAQEPTTDPAEADGTAEDAAPPEPGRGPWDDADRPELGERVDLGALRVPKRPGLQMRLEIEKKSQQVVAVSLGKDGSSVQLQVFAAPRSAGLWEELRGEIAASVTKQGGTVDEVPGTFGPELLTRLPVAATEGRSEHRAARFVGIDGPRWFLRAVFTGKAAQAEDAAAFLEDVLADVVVVRGQEARAPRDVLLLHLPGKAPGAGTDADGAAEADLLPRGPEITEIR